MPKFEGPVFGAPCWVDLTVGNLDAVKPFYAALFGWEFADQGEQFGHYNMVSIGGAVVGGAMQYSAEYMGPEEINAWSTFFATENAEASLQAASEHGGQVITPAMEVPTQGTMASATDVTGANYGLWQPAARRGFDKFGEHGFPGWFELHTRDFDAAGTYYSAVLPAELTDMPMGDDARYATLNINGEPQAGIFDVAASLPEGVPNHWLVYFIVDDTDAAMETARNHGGTVLSEAVDSPQGRFAKLQDPSGATFFVISGAEM